MPLLGLQQSQTQRQIQTLAPQMRQGLDMLQTPAFALGALIRHEAERNPLLSVEETAAPSIEAMREEGRGGDVDQHDGEDDGGGAANGQARADDDSLEDSSSPDAPREPSVGDFSTLGDDYADDLFANSGEGEYDPDAQERRQFLFDSIPSAESLQEHLSRQIEEADLTPRVRAVAEQICGSLDDDGYLRTPLADAAQAVFATPAETDAALAAVQSFTPAGVGARDLRECLLLQLRAEPATANVPASRVCASPEAFAALAEHRFDRAAAIAGISQEEAAAALRQLSTLDPFPGRRFSAERATFVKPEIFVDRDPETGRWTARLDERDIPRVYIPNRWRRRHRALKSAPTGVPESAAAREARVSERRWIDAMLRSGDALLFNIEQRRATLQAVAQAVVDAQTDFFERGPDALRPLAMSEIAAKVGISESTVSRAVAGKWVRSPRGLHEMRKFFGGGVKTETGENASVEAVKRRLREMVAAENPSDPLSDQTIAQRFAAEGVKLARRTIAKYREALKIPSSSMRRK